MDQLVLMDSNFAEEANLKRINEPLHMGLNIFMNLGNTTILECSLNTFTFLL